MNFIGGVESRELSAAGFFFFYREVFAKQSSRWQVWVLGKKKKESLINWTWTETSDVRRRGPCVRKGKEYDEEMEMKVVKKILF